MKFRVLFYLGLAIAFVGISRQLRLIEQSVQATTIQSKVPVAEVIESQGSSEIKRESWSGSQPAFIGTQLFTSDQLKVAPNATLLAVCYSTGKVLKLQTTRLLTLNKECPLIPTDDGPIVIPRSPDTIIAENIPYIISPRSTKLLTNRPILRWNPVAGATRYTVRLKGNADTWTVETTQTEINYPTDQPSLQPGIYYDFIVTTDTEVSSLADETAGIGFELLNETQAQQLKADIAAIQNQQLSPEAKVFAIAALYQNFNVKAEALMLLETLVKQGNQTPAIYQKIGQLYWSLGLSSLAENAYLQALQYSSDENLESSAQVHQALADIYAVKGQLDQAIQQVKMAQENYQALGDLSELQELQSQVQQLEKNKI